LALLQEGIDALGAESAVFISFVRAPPDVSSCRFMLACEPDWCQRYLDAGFIAQDPWIAYAAHHSEPIVASTPCGTFTRRIDEPRNSVAIAIISDQSYPFGVPSSSSKLRPLEIGAPSHATIARTRSATYINGPT
jgi:hypothetical protein